MFTTEIRINGALIAHIYGRNCGHNQDGAAMYSYEYYEPETREVMTGQVTHMRDDRIRHLVKLILEDVGVSEI